MKTQTHQESIMGWWGQNVECCSCKLRDAKDGPQTTRYLEEARKDSLTSFRRSITLLTPWFQTSSLQTGEAIYFWVSLAMPFVVFYYGSPRKQIHTHCLFVFLIKLLLTSVIVQEGDLVPACRTVWAGSSSCNLYDSLSERCEDFEQSVSLIQRI